MNFISSLKQILDIFYSKGRWKFFAVLLISFAGIVIELLALMMLYLVVSSLMQFQNSLQLPLLHFPVSVSAAVFGLLAVYLLKFAFSIWQNRYFIDFCYRINYTVTSRIIDFYYNQTTDAYKSNKLADALNKVFTIGGFFSEIIFQSVLTFFSELFLTVIIVVSLLIFNYKLLLLLVLILLPVCIVLLYFSRKRLRVMSGKIMTDNVEYHQSVMTLFMGLLDVKLSGRYAHFFDIYKSKINALHNTRKVITLENGFPPKVLEFTAILGIAALFFITRQLGNDIHMAGLLAAFATATFRFIPSINRIISSIQNLQLYTEYIEFISNIKDKPEKPAKKTSYEINSVDSIGLKDICFSYPGHEVLNNISFNLESGHIYGITGTSGSGKTTLVNIVSGLLEPQSGEMMLNNERITPEIKEALLHKSAYVMQNPYFFNGTVVENLVFGYDNPDMSKLEWCIKSVNMNQWLNSQTKGFETILGENAVKLSGGQKQRLAIARALYRKANILILDEPSSSLDSENKLDILNLIQNLTRKEKLITIIVSHDEEVLSMCDSISELSTAKLNPIK